MENALNCEASAYSMCAPARPASAATRAPEPKSIFLRAKPCVSNPERSCSPSTRLVNQGPQVFMPDDPSPPLEYQIFDPEHRELRVVVVQPTRPRYWLHILLFLATLLSTLCIGARLQYDFNRNVWPLSDGDDYFLPWGWALAEWHRLALGVPFAACLLGILTVHEL